MLLRSYPIRFSIDNFLSECKNLDWLDMFVRCQDASILTGRTSIPEKFKHINDMRLSFGRFTNHLCFIITKNNRAVIPVGMSTENFLKVRPIIERLVSQDEINKEWLTLY